MPEITLIYNKSNPFGITRDVELLTQALGADISRADLLEPPSVTAVAIHLEIPAYVWMPWASVNILMVNPEWWEDAWEAYLPKLDCLLFKCAADESTFCARYPAVENKCFIIQWAPSLTAPEEGTGHAPPLWLLGGSASKRAAAASILPLWPPDEPLTVYTTTALDILLPSNITIHVKDLTLSERAQLQADSPLHLIFSEAEAFGMAAAEGEAVGAFLLGNALPVYKELYGAASGSAAILLDATLVPYRGGQRDIFAGMTKAAVAAALKEAKAKLSPESKALARASAANRRDNFREAITGVITTFLHKAQSRTKVPMPPYLSNSALPSISIVTLTYNRRKFLDLCFINLLSTDYPKEKIEWVVVDDSDDPEQQGADKIMKFGRQCAPMSVTYLPLAKKTSIGAKRNIGCLRAAHDIIVMADDDDYIPPSGLRRRVAWLSHPWESGAAAATTIATYSLTTGVSAVNTPPHRLPLSQRISESTLTFSKTFWRARGFPEVSMSEGDEFLKGREGDVIEMPPNQIIVAMSHGKSASQRRVPEGKPGCFWDFDPQFITFLHGLVDVAIDAEIAESSAS